MSRIYVDEYDKVASIVRGDSPDQCGLFECQQRLFAWCSAAFVLKQQRDHFKDLLDRISDEVRNRRNSRWQDVSDYGETLLNIKYILKERSG